MGNETMQLLLLFSLYFLSCIIGIQSGKLPYCVHNEYATGRWVYDNSTDIKKSFICCAYNHLEKFADENYCFPLDPKFNKTIPGFQVQPGKPLTFRYTPNQGSNEYFMYPEGNACSCDLEDGSYGVYRRERYYWKPDMCTLPRWNAKDFCRLISNRTVLVLGDSTGTQTFATLVNMITSGHGGCATQIRFDWSTDLKQNTRHECLVCGSNDIYTSITTQPAIPDIVFILSGAHVKSIEEFKSNWEAVDTQLKEIHALYPNIKFIYKSQNPGHSPCAPHSFADLKPTVKIPALEDDQFNWRLHPEFDRIAFENIKILQTIDQAAHQHHQQQSHTNSSISHVPFIQYMDMTPLKYRQDAHTTRDCLHYCTPGPLDLFSILVYNKLLRGEL
jgi:hypothetical protein